MANTPHVGGKFSGEIIQSREKIALKTFVEGTCFEKQAVAGIEPCCEEKPPWLPPHTGRKIPNKTVVVKHGYVPVTKQCQRSDCRGLDSGGIGVCRHECLRL